MSENDVMHKPKYNEWADKAVRIVAEGAMKSTGHRVIATTHILMGVLKDGPAANLLKRSFNVKLADVAQIVENMSKPIPQGIGDDFLYTDGAKAVLNKAQELSAEYGFKHRQIYTDHLLAALLLVCDEAFAHVMGELGVDLDDLTAQAMKALEEKMGLANS